MRMLRVATMGVFVLMMGVSGGVSGGELRQYAPPPQRFPGQAHQPGDLDPMQSLAEQHEGA